MRREISWTGSAKANRSPGLWAWSDFGANLGGAEGPEQVSANQVTPGQISGMGVTPIMGRDFLPEEDQPGKDHVVVLTNRFWMRRFGADRDIVGRPIRINGEPYTVVGVLPPGRKTAMPQRTVGAAHHQAGADQS